jgi:hypothetical protein
MEDSERQSRRVAEAKHPASIHPVEDPVKRSNRFASLFARDTDQTCVDAHASLALPALSFLSTSLIMVLGFGRRSRRHSKDEGGQDGGHHHHHHHHDHRRPRESRAHRVVTAVTALFTLATLVLFLLVGLGSPIIKVCVCRRHVA